MNEGLTGLEQREGE